MGGGEHGCTLSVLAPSIHSDVQYHKEDAIILFRKPGNADPGQLGGLCQHCETEQVSWWGVMGGEQVVERNRCGIVGEVFYF